MLKHLPNSYMALGLVLSTKEGIGEGQKEGRDKEREVGEKNSVGIEHICK